MARLKVVHTLEFSYEFPVHASYNEVRVSPLHEMDQSVLTSALTLTPSAPLRATVDAHGTTVHEFELLAPHKHLELRAETVVAVRRQDEEDDDSPVGLASVTEWASRRLDLAEQLVLTPLTAPHPAVGALARRALDPEDVEGAARAILAAVRAGIEYRTGVTTVHSSAHEVWELGFGVCQDIAHVALGALREVGIPARYVSGYLHPSPEPKLGETVAGEAHAWVEWYAGRWVGFDVTNSIGIGNRHVVVGRGRDYRDVPPLRGVFDGEGSSRMDTTVEVTLLG